MIVEDELVAQRHLKNILQSLNVELAGAYDNAADARAALTRNCCEMILMDINIKGPEDGIQLTRSILQQYSLPVVFISAYSDGETLSEVMELSPYGFITKPFSAKDIEVAMGVAFSRYQVDKHPKGSASSSEKSHAHASKDGAGARTDFVTIGGLYHFDRTTQTLYRDDTMVRLNKKQLQLIEVLISHPNQIVDYGTIMEYVWPEGVAAESSLRTLIYSVRKLMPDFPIESHSKMGYALKDISA
jgi:DNA-binding response OmpR family regulator